MLVVDDEAENVEFMRRMFRKTYDVEIANSGTEALSLLEQTSYDVIITDQMMPGMTGTELLTRSLTIAPDAIRILVTGFPDLESAISSINEGKAYRFFTKPIDRKELAGAVDTAVDQMRSGDILKTKVDALVADREQLSERNVALEASIEQEVQERAGAMVEELAQLRARAPFDEETLLYNQREIQRRLEEELARSARYGLLCSFALLKVEECTQESMMRMSELLRLSVRRFDSAGRWSTDTFAVLMPHTDLQGAQAAVARLHAVVASDDDLAEPIPLSGAIAVYPTSGSTADELIAEAEKALFGSA